DWGPRLQLFVEPAQAHLAGAVEAAVADALPEEFLGYPTRSTGSATTGLGVLSPDGDRHGVTVTELGDWLRQALGFDPRGGVGVADWLATPTQRLAEITNGAVFHDGLDGALDRVRAALGWYPDDVWRYVLAAQWGRIAQAEHLAGRCAEVGDDLGSRVTVARVARDLMRLGLLLGRRYPPYDKWLGSEFARLPEVGPVARALAGAVEAGDWPGRQDALCRALEAVAQWSNRTGLAAPVDPTVRWFHRRPFLVLDAGRFADALRAAITDPGLRGRPLVGAVDQFVDSTEVLARPERFRPVALAPAGDAGPPELPDGPGLPDAPGPGPASGTG
ncbi:MAG TPA: DUF4037 domain-containing protein, partial [Micromonospora sp.]